MQRKPHRLQTPVRGKQRAFLRRFPWHIFTSDMIMKQKIIDEIMAHAEAEYPRECCGVLAQKSRVIKYFPCCNMASEPTEHFHLDPEGYAALRTGELLSPL